MKRIPCYIIEHPLNGNPRVYCAYSSKAFATRECAALNIGHWSMPAYTVVECSAWHAASKIE